MPTLIQLQARVAEFYEVLLGREIKVPAMITTFAWVIEEWVDWVQHSANPYPDWVLDAAVEGRHLIITIDMKPHGEMFECSYRRIEGDPLSGTWRLHSLHFVGPRPLSPAQMDNLEQMVVYATACLEQAERKPNPFTKNN